MTVCSGLLSMIFQPLNQSLDFFSLYFLVTVTINSISWVCQHNKNCIFAYLFFTLKILVACPQLGNSQCNLSKPTQAARRGQQYVCSSSGAPTQDCVQDRHDNHYTMEPLITLYLTKFKFPISTSPCLEDKDVMMKHSTHNMIRDFLKQNDLQINYAQIQ